jgi:cytochrome P450
LYGALNAFDPGHLYRSLSFKHPFRSANILSKRYTQQAYLQLQALLSQYLKLTAATTTTSTSTSPSTPKSSSPPYKRSPVLTSLLEYHGERESSLERAEEKAIADIIAYLLGAISNVSSVLAWMIYDFSHHPEWRQRALDEAQLLFPQGTRQLGDRDRLRQAKVLRKCIQESIRLRDRFTTGIRRLTRDVTVPLPKSSVASSSSVAPALPSQPDSPSASASGSLSSTSVSPPEVCSSSATTMTFQKGSYVILPYYYDGIDDISYNPDRQLPRTHFSMFGSGTHTCRGRDYAIAQITAMIAWLLLADAERRTARDVTTTTSSSSCISSSFRWCGIGPWVSSVPCSMASFTGVNSPPDDAPLYVEM